MLFLFCSRLWTALYPVGKNKKGVKGLITNGFMYLGTLIFFVAIILWLQRYTNSKFFDYVPPVVIIYFGSALLFTFGIIGNSDDVKLYYNMSKNNLLPVMLFLMLLRCDLRQIARLGKKMLLGFFSAMFSIMAGFLITYALFKRLYIPDTWKAFAALCGSWIGGTGNMVAVQSALNVEGEAFGYALLMDSVNYGVWVMLLLWTVSFAKQFNKWTKSDTAELDKVGNALEEIAASEARTMQFTDIMMLLGLSTFIGAIGILAKGVLPDLGTVISGSTWTVLIVSTAGILAAMTPIGKIPGSNVLGNVALYIMVAVIASQTNFSELTQAPIYILSGFVILAIHGLLLGLLAKAFKLDLFTCGVASLANIGGVASAPILAGAHNQSLVPVGVLMALLGYICGTYFSLLTGQIMSML